MPSRAEVIAEARRWIDTPYHHMGRNRGASCDCIGLVIGIARRLRLPCPTDRELPVYTPLPHNHIAQRTVETLMDISSKPRPSPGQVGLFWFRQKNHGQHFCIFGDQKGRLTMIHAYLNSDFVVEAGYSAFWSKRLMRVYDYRGVDHVAV